MDDIQAAMLPQDFGLSGGSESELNLWRRTPATSTALATAANTNAALAAAANAGTAAMPPEPPYAGIVGDARDRQVAFGVLSVGVHPDLPWVRFVPRLLDGRGELLYPHLIQHVRPSTRGQSDNSVASHPSYRESARGHFTDCFPPPLRMLGGGGGDEAPHSWPLGAVACCPPASADVRTLLMTASHPKACPRCGENCSWPEWRAKDEYSAFTLTNEAVSVIKAHAPQQRLFLYLAYQNVHCPTQVPDSYVVPYAALPEPRRTFAGMLAALDEGVGNVTAALKANGLWENTVLWFQTDNGTRHDNYELGCVLSTRVRVPSSLVKNRLCWTLEGGEEGEGGGVTVRVAHTSVF